jgi:carboxymethylenebutenolidase
MLKVIKRIALGIGIVLIGLVGLLAASIIVDGLVGGNRLDAVTNTRLANPNGPELRAYVARPAKPGTYPAVIMIHEFWGLNADIVGKADALAQEGYVVIAPNLFRGSTTGWIPSAIYQIIATPSQQINADLDAAFNWLAAQPVVTKDRIGIMGFCFGGGSSLRYSLANNKLAATVILYGSPVTDPNQLRALPGPVLGIFGGADQSISVTQVREFEAALKQAQVPAQISIYEGQPHAFVSTIAEIKKGGAPGQAWNQVLDFFKKNLQGTASLPREVIAATNVTPVDWSYWVMLVYEHSTGSGAHH